MQIDNEIPSDDLMILSEAAEQALSSLELLPIEDQLKFLGFTSADYQSLEGGLKSAFGPMQKIELKTTVGHLKTLIQQHKFTPDQLRGVLKAVGGAVTLKAILDQYQTLSKKLTNDQIAKMASYLNGYQNLTEFLVSHPRLSAMGFAMDDIAQIACGHGASTILKDLVKRGKALLQYISHEEIKRVLLGRKNRSGENVINLLVDNYSGLMEVGKSKDEVLSVAKAGTKELKAYIEEHCDNFNIKQSHRKVTPKKPAKPKAIRKKDSAEATDELTDASSKENSVKRKYTKHDNTPIKTHFFKPEKTYKSHKSQRLDDVIVDAILVDDAEISNVVEI